MPSTHRFWNLNPRHILSAVCLIIGLSACESSRPRHTPRGDMVPPSGERPMPVATMEGQGLFFAGRIEVECLLAPGGMRWAAKEADEKTDRGGGRRGGGGFSMSGSVGGGGMRGGMGSGDGGEGDRRGGGYRSAGNDAEPRLMIRASRMPPVQLRLRLTNHGDTPVTVEVLDFNSAIGNFVVQPDKIVVDLGAVVEAEPMNSTLGVPGDEVPLTVRLQVEGRQETRVVKLKMVPPPPAAPPAVAPADPGK
ncbi:MAG: hypothetical protein K9N01_15500 [Cephaloticoccus sp.]|nr:hypothetical protein [Cephaloticoccus sp.]